MGLIGMSCVFPCQDVEKTAKFYEAKLGFRIVRHMHCQQPHVCMYRDKVEIILIKSQDVISIFNRDLCGYGYDAYIYTSDQAELEKKFEQVGVRIVLPLGRTDYGNDEFVVEDIDGRWIAFGLRAK